MIACNAPAQCLAWAAGCSSHCYMLPECTSSKPMKAPPPAIKGRHCFLRAKLSFHSPVTPQDGWCQTMAEAIAEAGVHAGLGLQHPEGGVVDAEHSSSSLISKTAQMASDKPHRPGAAPILTACCIHTSSLEASMHGYWLSSCLGSCSLKLDGG